MRKLRLLLEWGHIANKQKSKEWIDEEMTGDKGVASPPQNSHGHSCLLALLFTWHYPAVKRFLFVLNSKTIALLMQLGRLDGAAEKNELLGRFHQQSFYCESVA